MKIRGNTVGTPIKPEKNLVKATDLTEEEKAQARENIGAADVETIGDVESALDGITEMQNELIESGGSSGGSSIELDATLTQEGQAADAKAVGDKLGDIENTLDDITEKPVKLYVLDSRADRFEETTLIDTQAIALMQIPVKDENGVIVYKNLLIDAGDKALAKSHIRMLNDLGVYKIDYVYITHYHEDHVGIFDYAAENTIDLDFSNAKMFLPYYDKKWGSGTVDACYDYVHNISSGDKCTIGNDNNIQEIGELKLEFFNYNNSRYYESNNEYYSGNHNDTSLCCLMTYGETKIGFFGDLEPNGQDALYNELKDRTEYSNLSLANVPHHAVNETCNNDFCDFINPKMCFTQDAEGHGVAQNEQTNYGEAYQYAVPLERYGSTYINWRLKGIPNYAVSTNGTMLFNVTKDGITTDAKSYVEERPSLPLDTIWVGGKNAWDDGGINPNYLFTGQWKLVDKGYENLVLNYYFDPLKRTEDIDATVSTFGQYCTRLKKVNTGNFDATKHGGKSLYKISNIKPMTYEGEIKDGCYVFTTSDGSYQSATNEYYLYQGYYYTKYSSRIASGDYELRTEEQPIKGRTYYDFKDAKFTLVETGTTAPSDWETAEYFEPVYAVTDLAEGVTVTRVTAHRAGSTVRLIVNFTFTKTIDENGSVEGKDFTDTETKLFKLNLDEFGIDGSISNSFMNLMVANDSANGIVIARLESDGTVTQLDFVSKIAGADGIRSSATYYFDVTFPLKPSKIPPRFCDKFYWRRIS